MAVFFTRRGAPPSLGTRLGDLEIGTIVHIKENGAYQDYLVVNQGLPSSMYDSSCNGTWLLRSNIYVQRQWDAFSNNYKNSSINSYLNNEFLLLFDGDIQNAIKQAKVPYTNEGNSPTVNSGANGLSCKIFLLSGYEVGLTQSINSYLPADGAKLSYFSFGLTTEANNKRIAKYNGAANGWWLRSPYIDYFDVVWTVDNSGSYVGSTCSRSSGIRPALIMPPDLLVDDNNNIF